MSALPNRDRRAERREATRREILDAAWEIARRDGLSAITLREVAGRIGMRSPSLYSHFDAKNAIYDAMFAEAWGELSAVFDGLEPLPAAHRRAILAMAEAFFDFAVTDLDLCTAMIGGFVDQQLANDPGGTRWRRQLPRLVDMYCNEAGVPGPPLRRI